MSLLDYQPDPLGQGLLGAGMALMTPRAMGGGVPGAFGAFNQGLLQAQAMRRQMEQDALQRKLLDLKMSEAAESAEDRKRKREQERALQEAARAAYTPASPGSLGGGVAPGSQQGRMLLDQMSGDPEFDRAMLSGTNAALNTVGPQQPVSAPTAGGFDRQRFVGNLYGAGMPMEAMRVEKEMRGENPFGKIDPKDYTRESIAAFARTGNVGDLVPARKLDFVNGQAVDSYNVQPGTVIPQQPPFEYEIGPDGSVRMKPGVLAAKTQVARAGAASNNVTLVGEREEAKVVGGEMGKKFVDIQNAGMTAAGKINNLTRLETLLSGYETGRLAPIGKEIASYAASVGINIDKNLGNKEAAEALSNELALAARSTTGGAGMPGAMSDADREFLRNMVPSLSKTPQGNRAIIETQRRLAKRDVEVAKLAGEYRARNGTLDPGFFQQLQAWSDSNPLFADLASVPVTAPDGRSVTGTIGKPGASGWSIKRVQ